jgi:hypothetical protein
LKKISISIFFVFSVLAFTSKIACAQEVLAGEDYKTDVVVLNEELRKIRTDYVSLTGDQTISGVKTFTSFPVTPSSAPTADYETANKKYVDDKVSIFGAWVDKSSSYGAQQAATDGFVVAFGVGTGAASNSWGTIAVYTDANSNPTTKRIGQTCFVPNGTAGYVAVVCPIIKGQYWKVTVDGIVSITGGAVYWIPSGS